jgi:hypothetical protein
VVHELPRDRRQLRVNFNLFIVFRQF